MPRSERGILVLQVSDIGKVFGKIRAVDGVTLTAAPGEVVGLLGPNGAGKTTLMRMIATVLRPTSGTAAVDGHDIVTDPAGVRRAIGLLPTDPGLYGRLTAVENLKYYGRLHSIPERELNQRIERLLERFNLFDERNRRTAGFSKGMSQKVSLIRSILHDPPVLLLDEPTAGLDVPAARNVHDMVCEFKSEGKCIVFSTHQMTEAEKVCDRIIIMARGRIAAQGTFEELRRQSGREDLEDIFMRLVGEAS